MDRVRKFITEDEEETARRWILRERQAVDAAVRPTDMGPVPSRCHTAIGWSDDERVVIACRQVARRRRGTDPFALARQTKGWKRERWDAACVSYERTRSQRRTEGGSGGGVTTGHPTCTDQV